MAACPTLSLQVSYKSRMRRAGCFGARSSGVPFPVPFTCHCVFAFVANLSVCYFIWAANGMGRCTSGSILTLGSGCLTAGCWTVFEPAWQRAPCCAFRLATNFGCSDRVAEITLVAMQDLARHAAANDTNYLPTRHRTLPILASITPIANYPSKLRSVRPSSSSTLKRQSCMRTGLWFVMTRRSSLPN